MIIMPSNNTGQVVKDLYAKYPDRMALLLNPHRIGPYLFKYRYAIDNAAFNQFNEKQYFKMLDFSTKYHKPLFIVCPDVVGCADRTMALWHYYKPMLDKYDYPIAFVAQDGCEPEDIPDEADWIFIGGLDPWKQNNIHRFVGLGKPVHVGRVNGPGRFKYCESLGVDSVDGTGWMRAGYRQKQLICLLEGDKQCSLF